jgi:DNA-binding transcriptional regulator YiaG
MIHLAHLSSDPRVRSVARAWQSLTEVEKIETRIEELCRAAGIGGADFIGCVAGTAWELGIDVASFLTGRPGHAVSLRSAIGGALMTRQPIEVWLSPNKWNRRRDRLRAAWASRASGEAAGLRRRSRLSQAQFASLFMTSARTVRRWEAGLSALTTHQQFFLRLFAEYIERNGVREFRRRFVRGEPRYGKAGRPAV